MFIGTDPKEWWRGYDKIVTSLQKLWSKKKAFKTTIGEIQAFREGTVGWFDYTIIWKFLNDSELPFRITGVLHQENDEWKFVQMKFRKALPMACASDEGLFVQFSY